MKEPRISVVASEELLLVLMQCAAAVKASRKVGTVRTPAVLNALIVQVSTARGTWEHAQKAAAKPADVPHELYQGETGYVWHQSCQCHACSTEYARHVEEQRRGVQTV